MKFDLPETPMQAQSTFSKLVGDQISIPCSLQVYEDRITVLDVNFNIFIKKERK
jgi:hypothetical protein